MDNTGKRFGCVIRKNICILYFFVISVDMNLDMVYNDYSIYYVAPCLYGW